MPAEALKNDVAAKMEASLEALRKDFSSIRTGRAHLGLLDGISVDYYGTMTPLSQVAALSVPDPRTITVQPWEQNMVAVIEKAIFKSDLGLTPSNDGKVIRLPIPALTEERRQQIVKQAKKRGEDAKVSVRNARREGNDKLKKLEKNKEITADEHKRVQDEIQKLTDAHIKKIDEIVAHKEAEIMEV